MLTSSSKGTSPFLLFYVRSLGKFIAICFIFILILVSKFRDLDGSFVCCFGIAHSEVKK